jgi:hypothetical protein
LISGFDYPAFKIITHDEQGIPHPEWSNTRRDVPVDAPLDHNGEPPPKYKFPDGKVSLYAPRPDSWRLWEESSDVWLAEGEGKTLALIGAGKVAIGFAGIQNWHRKDEKTLHPQLDRRIRQGKKVTVAVDGDWRTNPNVLRGTVELLRALVACGADAVLVDIPDVPGCAKPGIDDWIAHLRTTGQDVAAALAALPIKTLDDLTGSPVKLSAYSEIIMRPSPQWIVKNLIPPGELTAIVGPTSCGKTFLTMDLLLALARGQEFWFGQRIKRHGLVVHLTLEGTSLGNRLNAYRAHHDITGDLPYVALEVPINLREPPTALINAIERQGQLHDLPVVLVAVDTVNRAMGGGEENSSEHMGAFLASAERIKTAFPGCGVLLVHHIGKDPTKGARGHSSFSANVGAQLHVDQDESSGIRTVTMDKQRDATTETTFNFKLTQVSLGPDEDGEPITSCVVEASTAPAAIEASDGDIYDAIRLFWVTEFQQKPMAKGKVKENYSRIGEGRFTQRELMSAWQWAENNGLLLEAEKYNNGASRYTLKAREPKDPKY